MAKLNSANANLANEKAEEWGDGFAPLPPGVYLCKLREVDSSKNGPSGPYWVWNYETVGIGDEPRDRRFWDNTSLSEKAIGRLGKVFAAFGVPADTDTDDLIGKVIAVEVTQSTQQGGKNAGQLRNEVVNILPADSHPLFEDYVEEAGTPATSASDF